MQAALKRDFVAVDDYLAGEEASELKNEYIGGTVYAMAGVTTDHNQIAGNFYASFKHALRGSPCRVFISDVKVRLDLQEQNVFYYFELVF